MDRVDAKRIQRQRNKARKDMKKYQKLLLKSPIGSKEFLEYQARYQAALIELENTCLTYKQAFKELFGVPS